MYQEFIEELKNSLAEDRYHDNLQKWANHIIDNQIPMMDLMELLYVEESVAKCFTWMFGHVLAIKPEHIVPIVPYCFERRESIKFAGFDRTVAKMLAIAGIPDEIEGEVVDVLFKWVVDFKKKVAVKVFAIDALANIVAKYPELKEELVLVIENQWDKNSVAFQARAKQVLKRLKKIS